MDEALKGSSIYDHNRGRPGPSGLATGGSTSGPPGATSTGFRATVRGPRFSGSPTTSPGVPSSPTRSSRAPTSCGSRGSTATLGGWAVRDKPLNMAHHLTLRWMMALQTTTGEAIMARRSPPTPRPRRASTAAGVANLPNSAFAYPAIRIYPNNTINRARNALARAAQPLGRRGPTATSRWRCGGNTATGSRQSARPRGTVMRPRSAKTTRTRSRGDVAAPGETAVGRGDD
jgi:hypothetical protein